MVEICQSSKKNMIFEIYINIRPPTYQHTVEKKNYFKQRLKIVKITIGGGGGGRELANEPIVLHGRNQIETESFGHHLDLNIGSTF